MDRVNQKMKKFTLRGVIDGFRATVANNALPKVELGIEETVGSEHFQVAKVTSLFSVLLEDTNSHNNRPTSEGM